jgi:hypothetical protein
VRAGPRNRRAYFLFRDETAICCGSRQVFSNTSDKTLLMSGTGRRTIATPAQRAEVCRLAAEGSSVRKIAEAVFGNRRFRGRVERIVKSGDLAGDGDAEHAIAESEVSAGTVPTVRRALERYLARVQRREIEPSPGEMVKLLDLERRLQAFEAIAQINALTRDFNAPVDDL